METEVAASHIVRVRATYAATLLQPAGHLVTALGVIPRGMTHWEASFSPKYTIAYDATINCCVTPRVVLYTPWQDVASQ